MLVVSVTPQKLQYSHDPRENPASSHSENIVLSPPPHSPTTDSLQNHNHFPSRILLVSPASKVSSTAIGEPSAYVNL